MDKERTKRQRRIKRKAVAQWINLNQNNSLINQTQLPLLCEKSGAILLVLVGLMADRLADRQSDQILVDSKILKILY